MCVCECVTLCFEKLPKSPQMSPPPSSWSRVKSLRAAVKSLPYSRHILPFTALFLLDFMPCYSASTPLRLDVHCVCVCVGGTTTIYDSCDMLWGLAMHGFSEPALSGGGVEQASERLPAARLAARLRRHSFCIRFMPGRTRLSRQKSISIF